MIYGTIAYDPDGEEYIGRIFLSLPEHLEEFIMCTESDSPSTDINDGDWHPYEGEDEVGEYYLINGKYYPEDSEEIDNLIDDWNKLQSYIKIDVYSQGKLIKTYYK